MAKLFTLLEICFAEWYMQFRSVLIAIDEIKHAQCVLEML